MQLTTLQESGSDLMIFQSKQKVNDAPVWEVDTDTQTVRHRSPKTGKTERYVFHTDQIRYYLHHIEDKRPDLLQEIVDKGEIYKHLDELDTKVTDAVNRQTDCLCSRAVTIRLLLNRAISMQLALSAICYVCRHREPCTIQ